MVTAEQVDAIPGRGWNAKGALNLPEIWSLTAKYMPANFPMPVSVFVSICFEETACCNMLQQETPAAIGPGQLQVSEIGKVDFFADKEPHQNNFLGVGWDSSMTLLAVDQRTGRTIPRHTPLHPDLTPLRRDYILALNEFSVRMHVNFFRWLSLGYGRDGEAKGLTGLLAAQTGGRNLAAGEAFKNGGRQIAKLMDPDTRINYGWTQEAWNKYYALRREEFRNALNVSRKAIKGNAVPKDRVKFWEFFLPDEFLQSPRGYIKLGF